MSLNKYYKLTLSENPYRPVEYSVFHFIENWKKHAECEWTDDDTKIFFKKILKRSLPSNDTMVD